MERLLTSDLNLSFSLSQEGETPAGAGEDLKQRRDAYHKLSNEQTTNKQTNKTPAGAGEDLKQRDAHHDLSKTKKKETTAIITCTGLLKETLRSRFIFVGRSSCACIAPDVYVLDC